MKLYYSLFAIFIVISFDVRLGSSEFKFASTLPAGEYRIKLKAIMKCNTKGDNKFNFNLYAVQTANGSSTIKGNITTKMTFDDSLSMYATLAIKNPNGNWMENILTQRASNACSGLKRVFGNEWHSFLKSFGLSEFNSDCRIFEGDYSTSGLDVAIHRNTNLPKTFIYGTYKMRLDILRKNEILGCSVFVADIARP